MAEISVSQSGINIPQFLDLIAFSEGTSTSPITQDRGYDVIVSGIDGPHRMAHYNTHPFCVTPPRGPITVRLGPPELESTASGRYQLLARYFLVYEAQLGLSDFSPLSQDLICIQQLRECRAVPMIEAGNIEGAIQAASSRWASFPGNTDGQGGKTLSALMTQWNSIQNESLT